MKPIKIIKSIALTGASVVAVPLLLLLLAFTPKRYEVDKYEGHDNGY